MRDIDRRLRELPGIERVARRQHRAAHRRLVCRPRHDSKPTSASSAIAAVARMRVSPGFFATLGTPIVAGRDFDQREIRPARRAAGAARTVIVNESFARRYFKGRSPIGARMGFGSSINTVTDVEIIGVVKDFSRRNLRDGEVAQAFLPFWMRDSDDGTFYVRVRGWRGSRVRVDSRRDRARSIRRCRSRCGPSTIRSSGRCAPSGCWRRCRAGSACSRCCSSIVGLYGVMSFVVTQRTQEIGLRLALGATQASAVWLVVRDAVMMIGAGTLVALPAAWALRRLIEAQLFGVHAFDAPTIVLAGGMLALVALAATLIPARRAASISPTDALRLE